MLGIDARTPEKQQAVGAVIGCGFDDVVLDAQVVQKKLYLVGGIGLDATHARGRKDHVPGLMFREEGTNPFAIHQVEFVARAGDDFVIWFAFVEPYQGAADEAPVSGDEYLGLGHWFAVPGF